MQNNQTIHHEARVVRIEGNRVEVQMLQQSACATCDAAGLCRTHEAKTRTMIVPVPDASIFNVGDNVWLHTEVRLGMQASLLAYVAPLVLVVAVLAGGRAMELTDGVCALGALLVLGGWFAVLYAMRGRLSRKFEIKITNKQH